MMNRTFVAGACAATFLLSSAAGTAAAAEPEGGCPAPFDIGLLSIEESADLLLANGFPATREHIIAGVSKYDKNSDEFVCVMDYPDTKGNPAYVFNFTDNRFPV